MIEISNNSTSSSGTRSKRYMMFLVFYMICYEIFDTYTCSYYLAINSYIYADFGIGPTIWYFMIAIASIGYFFAIIMQFLADKVGRRPMMFFMFIFFTSDIWGIAMSEEAPPDKRAKYTSFILAIGIIASVSIPIIRDFFIYPDPSGAPRQTWENMAFFGGIAMILAFLGYFMKETRAYEKMKENKIGSTRFTKENIRNTLIKPFQGKNRNIVLVFIVVGFILGINYASLHSLEGLVSDVFYQDLWNIALYGAGAGSLFTFAMIGVLSDKIGRKKVLYFYAITLFLATIFIFISIETLSIPLIMFSVFLMNGFFWGLGSISRLMALESFDTDIRAYGSGWRSFSYALGLTIGSALSGLMTLVLDLHYIYIINALAIIILIPVLVWKYVPETTGKVLVNE